MTIRISFSDKTVRVAVEINGAIESAITELPQRTWVGLTEDDAIGLLPVGDWDVEPTLEFFQAVQQALKEKNNG